MSNTDDPMDKPVTRRELNEALTLWAEALDDRFDAKLAAFGAKIDVKIDAKIEALRQKITHEIAHQTGIVLDAVRGMIVALDDKYKDLPARVKRLENKVFPPTRRRRRSA